MKLKILFENSDLLAVDKPTGLSVHNAEQAENLLDVLRADFGKLSPVHRLDKETSGIQLLARNESAARRFQQEFEARQVKKIYIAILRGGLKSRSGVWAQPISDKSEGRDNPAGRAVDRGPAETAFEVQVQTRYFTQVQLDLRTGRQHQIRKHAALVRHSIVGDPRYGDKRYNLKISNIYQMNRMLLHCSRLLILDHVLESPLPAEFASLFSGSPNLG